MTVSSMMAQSSYGAAGLLGGCVLLLGMMQVLPRAVCRTLGLMLLLPATALAFLGPFLHRYGWDSAGIGCVQGGLLAIPVMFPVGSVLLRRPVDLNRIALGLGADRIATLRLVWLPLLLPSILLSAGIGIVLAAACLLLRPA